MIILRTPLIGQLEWRHVLLNLAGNSFHCRSRTASDMTCQLSIRVFKIEERGRLEERHGRRGPGSDIRVFTVVRGGKIKLRICFYDASCFCSVFSTPKWLL